MALSDQRMRAIMSGGARDFSARLLRAITLPLSWLFSLIARLRVWLYRIGLKRADAASVPVICVGNLSTGGTGKTPVVTWLVRELIAQGMRPGILSRGYGEATQRDSGEAGSNDEARMLAEILPDTPHVQNPDRVAGARALAEHGCDVIVLDDGFSHVRLKRDLDLLLFDATCPFGYAHTLPRGLLREPISAAKRADFAIITRTDQADQTTLDAIRAKLAPLITPPPALAQHAPAELVPVAGLALSGLSAPSELAGKSIAVMSGIGNPRAFRTTLEKLGAKVVMESVLPDHFSYNDAWLERDWPAIAERARDAEAECFVVTQKDAVKLRGRLACEVLPAYELRVTIQIDAEGAEHLRQALQQSVK